MYVCMFCAGDGACLDRELIPPQRQLGPVRAAESRDEQKEREPAREAERERKMNLTPGNRCPINISP